MAFFSSSLLDSALNTLFFTGRCIHRRFLGFLQLSPRPLPLLTVVAPLPWCLGRSAKCRQPTPLPLPFRVGSRWAAKVRRPFRRLWPLRWLSPGCRVKVLLTAIRLCCGWGLPVCAFGCYQAKSWVWSILMDESLILFRDSPPPLTRPRYNFRHTGWLSSVSGLASGGLWVLSVAALEIILQPSFPGGKGSDGLVSRDRPLSPERVCSAISVHHSTHSLCASVYPRGRFPSVHST